MTEGFLGSPGRSAPTLATAPSRPSTSPRFTLPSLGDSPGCTPAGPCRAAGLWALCRPRTRAGFRVVCLLPGLQASPHLPALLPSSGVNVPEELLLGPREHLPSQGLPCSASAWGLPGGQCPPLGRTLPAAHHVGFTVTQPSCGLLMAPAGPQGPLREPAVRAGLDVPQGYVLSPTRSPHCAAAEPDGARLCAHCSPVRPLPRDTGPVGPRKRLGLSPVNPLARPARPPGHGCRPQPTEASFTSCILARSLPARPTGTLTPPCA